MQKYDYVEFLTKNIKIQHSDLLHDDNIFGGQKMLVFFTNTQTGAQGTAVLPTYKWRDTGKLSKEDITFCNRILQYNIGIIFKFAREVFSLRKILMIDDFIVYILFNDSDEPIRIHVTHTAPSFKATTFWI